jgi:regulatory protein
LLEVQPRSRRDLARRLAERGHARADIEDALSRLEAVGVLDDRVYAEGFIRRRLRLRPRGRALLRRELKVRGVEGPVADQVLDAFSSELDEVALARAVLARRSSRWSKLTPAQRRRRAVGTLRRLGFAPAAIVEVIRSVS